MQVNMEVPFQSNDEGTSTQEMVAQPDIAKSSGRDHDPSFVVATPLDLEHQAPSTPTGTNVTKSDQRLATDCTDLQVQSDYSQPNLSRKLEHHKVDSPAEELVEKSVKNPKESKEGPIEKPVEKRMFRDVFKRMEKTSRNARDSSRKLFRAMRQNSAVSVQVEDLSDEDVIIAIMGPTGSGKSSFINMATGKENGVGHDLESCTTEIGIVKFQCPERSDLDVVFVDTPGFDDTNKTDVEILEMIAQWLNKTYERKIMLSGILYFHRISDNRMAGTPLKNLRMFKELCGKNALQNIILTTTMWDEVEDDTGSEREKELRGKYWKAMIDQGSTTARYHNTSDSAWDIVDQFLQSANDRHAVLLQQEMVEMERQLRETKAGQELYSTLEVLVYKQQETLQKIRKETKRHADKNVLNALKDEYEELRKQLTVTVAEMQTLKLPLGKRLLRALRSWVK